jgi:hypothetical protein
MVVFYEVDMVVPNTYIKTFIEKLKITDKYPTFLVPAGSVFNLRSYRYLISWKMFITDEVVEILCEGYLQKWFED